MNNILKQVILLVSATLIGCTSLEHDSTISEKNWVLSSYRCVFDCVEASEKFFKPLIGISLKLDGSELNAQPIGSCKSGDLIIDLANMSTVQRLGDFSVNLPDGMQFTPSNTGIIVSEILTGEIACKDNKLGQRTILTILSATESELIALEEDGILLVFRPR